MVILSDGLPKKINGSILNGSGAGQPLGIMNSGSIQSIAKKTGQADATIVYENILKMWSRLIGSARSDAVWLINQNVEPQLFSMSSAVGTGGVPVYLPAGGASNVPFNTLFGRPVLPCEQCQTLGDSGDIILGSFGRGYLFCQLGGIKMDTRIAVRFIYDESVFRFVLRIDGSPILSAGVTPFKGSDKLSHFVKLDDR